MQLTHVSLAACPPHHAADVRVVSAPPRRSTVADARSKASILIPPFIVIVSTPKEEHQKRNENKGANQEIRTSHVSASLYNERLILR